MATNQPSNFDSNATTVLIREIKETRKVLESRYGLLNMSKENDNRVKRMKRLTTGLISNVLGDLHLPRHKILFTSGASESNSQICHSLKSRAVGGKKIVVSTIEHKSLIMAAEAAFGKDNIVVVPPDPDTFIISFRTFKREVEKAGGISTIAAATVMAANNETGVINEFGEIANYCRKNGVWFHCDATQYIGKYSGYLSLCHSISASAHKFNGPKGKGFLFVDNKHINEIVPIIFGTQQDGLRGGTIDHIGNYLALTAFKLTYTKREEKNTRMAQIKDAITSFLVSEFPRAFIITDTLPNVVPVLFGAEAGHTIYNSTGIQRWMDENDIYIGVGSACNADDDELSYVIQQLKRTGDDVPMYWNRNFVRISFDDTITKRDIDKLFVAFREFKNRLN